MFSGLILYAGNHSGLVFIADFRYNKNNERTGWNE